MKPYKHYLTESLKTYTYRLKFANMSEDFKLEALEIALEKYSLQSVSKPKKTPIQEHPTDFQTLQNADVHIIDVEVQYPVTAHELHNYLSFVLRTPQSHLVVINKDHPEEIAREEAVAHGDDEYETIIGGDYAPSEYKAEDYFGDAFNKKFVEDQIKDREITPAAGSDANDGIELQGVQSATSDASDSPFSKETRK